MHQRPKRPYSYFFKALEFWLCFFPVSILKKQTLKKNMFVFILIIGLPSPILYNFSIFISCQFLCILARIIDKP